MIHSGVGNYLCKGHRTDWKNSPPPFCEKLNSRVTDKNNTNSQKLVSHPTADIKSAAVDRVLMHPPPLDVKNMTIAK